MTCRPRPGTRLLLLPAVLLLAAAGSAAPAVDSLKRAEQAIDNGDGVAAEMAVRAALQAGADRSEVAALAGEAELLQGDLEDARHFLGPAAFSPVTRARGLHALGRLNLLDNDLVAASDAFDRAMAAGGASAGLWLDVARLRYRNGQHDLVGQAVEAALALEPTNPRALEVQALLVRDSQGLIAALPLFERALQAAPDDLGLLGGYAATLGEAGRHVAMLKVARHMVEIDPRHPQAYFLQAVLAARAGKLDIARRLLWQTGGDGDAAPAVMLLQGILELRSGNAALAVESFASLERMQPENPRIAALLGRALLANGEANEVVARLAALANRPHASPYLLALVGRAYEQLGDRARAAPYLDRAATVRRAAPGALPVDDAGLLAIWRSSEGQAQPQAAVARLRQLVAQGQAGAARTLAADLLRQFPGSADMERLSGDVSLLTGAPDAALAAYDRVARTRTDLALVQRMAAAERAAGRGERALQRLERYASGNPRSVPALAVLGRAAADRGQLAPAAALLGTAARLGGGTDPDLLARTAQAQAALGRNDDARRTARLAYRLQRWGIGPTLALAQVEGGSALRAKASALAPR
jgi:tetratricopeptide (TPR) repeat protein